ncbi:DUF2326 domain-containing protein [Pseudomonas brenneri]
MRLVNVIIEVNGQQSRCITFHTGLNLVTNRPGSGRTGNSVGKSTLSRVVDFLFLGDLGSVYIDEEFKRPNEQIESFFRTNFVTASLNFLDANDQPHQIAREMATSGNGDFFTDGEKTDSESYDRFIQVHCFGINSRRPSVRSLIPKFVRNDSHRMLNTTKFLDKRAGGKDYSELFLYLFGFQNSELLTKKRDVSNLLGRRKRNSTSINSMVKEQSPASEIKKYTAAANELERDLLKFEYSPEYSDPISRLTELQKQEDKLTNALLSTERKIENIQTTVDILATDPDGYLVKDLKSVYDFAGVSVDNALRDLEEVILFHQNLIERKRQFLLVDLPVLMRDRERFITELDHTKESKLKVFSDMRSTESLNSITNNLKQLGQLKIEIGKLDGLLGQQEKARSDLTLAEDELERILAEISKEVQNVYVFESVLNKHFKSITTELHAEEYSLELNFNTSTGACGLAIETSATNPEGGKKKAEVIAFDFAYINAVSELGLRRPLFVFHDSIEDIDKKQIEDIFKLAKKLPGQQILSMLSDKIDPTLYTKLKDSIILELDEDEKFFLI